MNTTEKPAVQTAPDSTGDALERTAADAGWMARAQSVARRSRTLASMGTIGFLVVVIVFFSITANHFLSYSNVINIIGTASVLLIISLGQLLTVVSGGFDLSVGGVVPLGAVVYALLTGGGVPALAAMTVSVVVGCAFGAFNALLIGRIGINPLIATLGTMSVAAGIAYTLAGGLSINVPSSAGFLGNPGVANIPNYVFLAIILTILVHVMLRSSGLGRRIYVVGGNAEAARVAGIRVGLVKAAVYMISSGLAALAGVVYASELLAASGSVGNDTALNSVAAVVLGGAAITGGAGGVPGTILGVLILGGVANGLSLMQVPAFYVQIVTGGVLVLAVTFGRLQQKFSERG